MWGMNAASLLLLFLFGWLFLGYVQRVRPGILAEVVTHYFNPIPFVISLVAVFVVMIVLHELLHGIFFWIFSHQPPEIRLTRLVCVRFRARLVLPAPAVPGDRPGTGDVSSPPWD